MSALSSGVKRSRKNRRLLLAAILISAVSIGLVVAQWPWASVFVSGSVLLLTLIFGRPEYIVYLFLFSSIFFKYRLELGFASLNAYRATFLISLAAIPFIPMHRGALLNQRMARTGLAVVLLAGLFISGWARSPGSYRPVATVNTLLLMAWLAFLLFLTYFVDRPARFEKLMRVFLATSSAVALYGLYEMFFWLVMGALPEPPLAQFAVESYASTVELGNFSFPRIESLFHDANLLAIYLIVGILIIFNLFLRERITGSRRLFLALLLIIHMAAVVVTLSRSGLLLLVFSLSLLIPRMLSNKTVRLLLFALLMGMAVVLLLALSFPTSLSITGDYLEAYRSRFTLDNETIRMRYAEAGFHLFSESPLVGVGMGHPELLSVSRSGLEDTAHSLYLTILSQYGILGLALVLYLLWPSLREATRVTLQQDASSLDRTLAMAVWVILLFQIIYDNLLGELMLFPFALVYTWALNRERFQGSES